MMIAVMSFFCWFRVPVGVQLRCFMRSRRRSISIPLWEAQDSIVAQEGEGGHEFYVFQIMSLRRIKVSFTTTTTNSLVLGSTCIINVNKSESSSLINKIKVLAHKLVGNSCKV